MKMVSRYCIYFILVFKCLCIMCDYNKLVVFTERDGNTYNSKCITRNFNEAITWIYPLTKSYNDRNENGVITQMSVDNDNWFQEQPHLNHFGPILDARWNNFETISTFNKQSGSLEFTNLNIGQEFYKQFEISISVRAKEEGHIFLCRDGDIIPPYNSFCYWIVLGGWGGTKSVLRKCLKGNIPHESVTPSYDCKTALSEQPINPLSEKKWTHITIIFDSHTKSISIRILGFKYDFLKFTNVKNHDGLSSIKSIYIQTRNSNVGLWKFHKYFYHISRKIGTSLINRDISSMDNNCCLSMYAAICKRCKFTLSLENYYNEVIHQDSYEKQMDSNWQRIKFSTNKCQKDTKYKLYANIDGLEIEVAIQDVQLHPTCFENVLNIVSIGPYNIRKNSNSKDISCQYLSNPESSTNIARSKDTVEMTDYDCAPNTFGSACVSCGVISNDEYCRKGLFCENVDGTQNCNCANGYKGDYCTKQCEFNEYGERCSKKCGQCSNECNNINGTCHGGCLRNFVGTKCDEADLPVTKTMPTVTLPCYTACLISVPKNNYFGKQEPTYMEIQYKKIKDQQWNIVKTSIDTLQSNISDLDVSTEYTVRVIYYVDDDTFYDEDIPMSDFTTSCIDITASDVTVNTTMDTAKMQIETENRCKLKDYLLTVSNTIGAVRTNVNLENNLELLYLTPFETYTVLIHRQDYFFNTTFRTQEGVPGKVSSLRVYSETDTSITLTWNEPNYPNGIIIDYRIKYEHKNYIACPNEFDKTFTGEQRTSSKTVTLNDLKPYSKYTILISARNSKNEGDLFEIVGTTKAQDLLNADAYTLILESESRLLKINFQPNCNQIFGSYIFVFTVNCLDAWCGKSIEYRYTLDRHFAYIYNLQPYSNYNLYTVINLRNLEKQVLSLPSMTFRTTADVPNPIKDLEAYSQDETSISLRWNPPYPPMGELEMYNMKYSYRAYISNPTSYKSFKPTTCSIWKQMHCITIDLLYYNYEYTIVLTAKNSNVSKYSSETSIRVTTTTEAPEPPINVNAAWDDFYNLTLEWTHPNKSNGKLKEFSIFIDRTYSIYPVEVYNLTYTKTTPVSLTKFTKRITYSVASKNSNSMSKYASGAIVCPPPYPQFDNEPRITNKGMDSISFNIPAARTINNNSYLLIVVSTPNNFGQKFHNVDFIKSYIAVPSTHYAWIAMELNSDAIQQSNNVVLGEGTVGVSNRTDTRLFNTKLAQGVSFKISLVLINEQNNYTRFSVYELEGITDGIGAMGKDFKDEGSGVIYLLLFLLVIPVIIVCLILKKHKVRIPIVNNVFRQSSNSYARTDTMPLTKQTVAIKPAKPAVPVKKESLAKSKYTKLVKLCDFEDYVKEAIFNGELARQHELFPRGEQKDCKYGRLPQNKSKNRYGNLTAYDHSRVKLQKNEGDAFSDYINANYILGFNVPNAYIATQGPKPTTLNDFWRMVWEQNVMYIVMLANVFENGKKKTEQYWPNINESVEFGDITVNHISSEVFADYENREFCVVRNNEERIMKQYHFTTWPDHGVPLYPQNLVPFLRKIIAIPQGESPIIVHCSAGVGRTGTIILIDTCLRMAAQSDTVDALYYLHQMREQRPNLVDNIEQYKLAHLVILECLVSPDTSVRCDENFEAAIQSVIAKDISSQMLHIANSGWQENAISENMSSTLQMQPEKDRFKDIIPESYGIIYLPPYPSSDATSTYINAVSVDAFNSPKRFIATQQPLPNTLHDFWRLALQNEVDIIISLQDIDVADPTCCQYLPTNANKELSMPLVTLTYAKSENHEHFRVKTIHLTSKNEMRKIQVIVLKGWQYGDAVPNNLSALLALWQQMNNLTWNDNRIIVTCRDGVTACGFYIAMCFILEKIKLEHICDVCHAVRVIRRSRKQFVESELQFISLYQTAGQYLREFEIYSNFTNK